MVLEVERRVTIKADNVLPQTSCSYCGLEWLEPNPTFVQGTLFTDQNAIYISCDQQGELIRNNSVTSLPWNMSRPNPFQF